MISVKVAASSLAFVALTSVSTASSQEMAMDVGGQGPVVVFEAGLGEGRESWKNIVGALGPCLTVVTYDRPGIGESGPPSHPATPILATAVANELLEQLRERRLPPPYLLVGHSLGGLYAQAFARNHPSVVAGLLLVDASSHLEPPGAFVSTVPPKPGSIEAAEEAGVAPSVAALLVGPPFPDIPLVVLAATRHGDTPRREELWRDVQRRTAAMSSKGRIDVIDSGHFIQAERPEAVIDGVLSLAVETGANIEACRH